MQKSNQDSAENAANDDVPLSNPFRSYLGSPPPVTLDPNRTALLVVDMQYFDAHPEWGEGRTAIEMGVAHCFDPYFAQIDDVIPRIQTLLDQFRRKQMEVIHLRVAEWTQDSRDVGWKQLVRGLIVPSNSKEADLLEEVAPIADEIVVSKSSSGVFPVTNLDRLLRNIGIRTLIFTGTSTGGCVESAVHDAVDLGYDVIIVSDGCADSTVAGHQLALSRMHGGLVRIMSTAEIEQQLSGLPDGDRLLRSGLERVKPYLPTQPTEPPGPDVNPYSLIFPPAIELPITSTNCALVLVDAIRYACDPAYGIGQQADDVGDTATIADYYARVQSALAKMSELLGVCRASGLPIIHIRTAGQLADGRDLSAHLQTQNIIIVQGSAEAEFMPTVAPKIGELIVNKPGVGIYTGTGLDELLRTMGIEHLVLAGISFLDGLESSIRSATDRSYGLILVADACAVHHPVLQNNLYQKQSGIIQVMDSTEVVAQLQALVHSRAAAPIR